jgi:hypothetical protein
MNMRPYPFFMLLLLLLANSTCFAQSVYRFHYQLPGNNPCDAFLLRYEDGSGVVRIRSDQAGSNAPLLAEADMNEFFVTDSITGITDTSTLFLRPGKLRWITIAQNTALTAPVFAFKYIPSTGFYDPFVVTGGALSVKDATPLQGGLVDRINLTKPLVSAFYTEDEEFYVNLFKTGSRGLSEAEKNIRLFLVIVTDTMDASVGTYCSHDLYRMKETFKNLTDYLGIKFIPQVIAGPDYSKANTEKAIANLNPAPADIVVFYYSGHGFRLADKHQFPFIKLKTLHKDRQDVLNNSLNIEDVFTTLRKKNARLTLVLSDCCNSDIETVNIKGTPPGKTKSSGVDWSEDNIRNLFLNRARFSVLATAADNGQSAAGNDNFGGFFSYFFKTSLENHCSKLKNSPNWFLVMQQAGLQTTNKALNTYCDKPYIEANVCRQNPLYKVIPEQ